jgi:hypothetical protein
MSQGRKDLVDKMLHGRGVQMEMLLGRCIEDFPSWLPSSLINYLKGLSHEIFMPVFWPVWMHLGLNVNRLWFKKFFKAHSIFDNYFKFWCASHQSFSKILPISEKD